MSLKFPRNEKLKSKKVIEALFSSGSSVSQFPLRMLFMPMDGQTETQAAFAVPKRTFGLAVDRNRIKRQMREAYRLRKYSLRANNEGYFALMFLYIGAADAPFELIDSAMAKLLKKLQK
jgi:ribonuclease P protein component